MSLRNGRRQLLRDGARAHAGYSLRFPRIVEPAAERSNERAGKNSAGKIFSPEVRNLLAREIAAGDR